MTTTSSPPAEGVPWSSHEMQHALITLRQELPVASTQHFPRLLSRREHPVYGPFAGDRAAVILPLPSLAWSTGLSIQGHVMHSKTKGPEALAHRTASERVLPIPSKAKAHSPTRSPPGVWSTPGTSASPMCPATGTPTPAPSLPYPLRRPHNISTRTPAWGLS